MAKPIKLQLRIAINYLDEDLLETSITYTGNNGVEVTKRVFETIAASLDKLTETDNKEVWLDGL